MRELGEMQQEVVMTEDGGVACLLGPWLKEDAEESEADEGPMTYGYYAMPAKRRPKTLM